MTEDEIFKRIEEDNKASFYLCKKCKGKPLPRTIMFAHRWCKIHQYGFGYYFHLEVRCPKCAKEKSMCQICGTLIKE